MHYIVKPVIIPAHTLREEIFAEFNFADFGPIQFLPLRYIKFYVRTISSHEVYIILFEDKKTCPLNKKYIWKVL